VDATKIVDTMNHNATALSPRQQGSARDIVRPASRAPAESHRHLGSRNAELGVAARPIISA